MGYLFLAIALFCGLTKGYCGKKTSGYVEGFSDAMLTNTIRMALCIVIGVIMIISAGDMAFMIPDAEVLLISALSGITTAIFVVTWMVSVKTGAYMMVNVFLMLGVLVPVILGICVFGETTTANQWIGMAVLLVAVIIMCSYNNSIKTKITPFALFLVTLSGVSNGLTGFSQKLFTKNCEDIPASVFNLYTYIFAAVVLVIFYFIFKAREKNTGREEKFEIKKIFGYVAVMALCLFMNSYFSTLAAVHLDSAILYPLSQGGSMILSTFMSAIFFKEKITAKCALGVTIAFVGLIIINVL